MTTKSNVRNTREVKKHSVDTDTSADDKKYHIAGKFDGGKFGKFGKSSVIHQTNLVLTIDNLLADLLIHQTFFHQILEKSQFAKLSPCQTFPLYGIKECTQIASYVVIKVKTRNNSFII